MSEEPIDFDDLKWGSLTKQLQAFNRKNKTKMDLESFSKHILDNPKKFIERSKDRARFYLNVIKPKAKKGGALSSHVMSDLLAQSYETKNKKKRKTEIDGFHIDPSLSGERVQVWYNPTTKQAVVVHRGTAGFQDVMTDARLFFGDKSGKRFRHAENIQKKAEAKYGKEHVSTLGHSLGSSVAEKVGQDSKEVLTLNKPTTLEDLAKGKKVSEKQTDVRTKYDPVSILRPYQKGNDAIEIESTTWNPLAEHKTDTLKRLDEDVMIGRGSLGGIMRGTGSGSSRVVPQETEVDADDLIDLDVIPQDVRVERDGSLIDRLRLPSARPVPITEGQRVRNPTTSLPDSLANREINRSFWNNPEIQRILAELQEEGSDDEDVTIGRGMRGGKAEPPKKPVGGEDRNQPPPEALEDSDSDDDDEENQIILALENSLDGTLAYQQQLRNMYNLLEIGDPRRDEIRNRMENIVTSVQNTLENLPDFMNADDYQNHLTDITNLVPIEGGMNANDGESDEEDQEAPAPAPAMIFQPAPPMNEIQQIAYNHLLEITNDMRQVINQYGIHAIPYLQGRYEEAGDILRQLEDIGESHPSIELNHIQMEGIIGEVLDDIEGEFGADTDEEV
jgi:hypothetical protein